MVGGEETGLMHSNGCTAIVTPRQGLDAHGCQTGKFTSNLHQALG